MTILKPLEVAEKLKLQLKKLELISILSDQMLQKKKDSVSHFFKRDERWNRSINTPVYDVSLYELLKLILVFKCKKLLKISVFQNCQFLKLKKELNKLK
jgi:hypothetical protein